MALWLRLALLSSCWNSSGFGKQGPSSATGQTSLRSRRGAILRDMGATTAGWCAGSAPAPESSVTFEAAQGLSGIGRQPEEPMYDTERSEEHTSELQSPCNLVCRLLLEKKKTKHLNI